MFDIEFIDPEPEPQDEGWLGLWGRITLGDYSERFIAPLGTWTKADYERQWIEAADRLVSGHERTAFVTAPFRFWWTMWHEGEDVFVHEELLTPERYAGPYDGGVPYRLIEERFTESEDGDQVSEWRVSFADILNFVERRASQYVPV
jgi:hypothetical protein